MNKPDESLWLGSRRNIVVVLRLIVFFIIYLIILQERLLGDMPPVFWVATGAFLLSEIICLFEHKTYFFVQRILGWIFVFDAALISLLIYLMGVQSSQMFIGYFAVIAIATISRSVLASFIITFLVSAFYLFASLNTGNFTWLEFLTRTLFFFGVAIFASYLTQEVTIQQGEREKAEKLLENSEQKYINLLANPLVGIYQSTLQGRFLYVNKALADILEYDSPEELRQVRIVDTYKSPAKRQAFIEQLKKNGFVTGFENELKTKTGQIRHVLISGALNGEIISGVIMDITERKQAERQYRLLADNVADVIWTTDMNFRFTYISPSVTNLLGYSIEEAMNLKLADLLPASSLQAALESVQKALEIKGRTGEVPPEYKSLRLEHIRKDKNVIWVEINGDFIYDSKGNPAEIIGVTRDITERKQAEEQLKHSEQRLKEAQSLGKIGNWEFDLATNKIEWSDEVYRIYGRDRSAGPPTPEEEAGYYAPDETRRLRDFTRQSIEKGEELRYDTTAKLPGNRIIYLTASMSPVKDAKGRVIKLFGTIQDITERKQAEESLKMHSELLDNSTDSIVLHDDKGRIIYANKAAYETRGYTKEEFVSITLADLDTAESAKLSEPRMKQLKETGRARFEVIHRRKNGSTISVDVNVSTIKLGNKQFILAVWRDITEQKIMEEHLLQAQKMETIGTLAGGIAHDFNNILAAIRGYAELAMIDADKAGSLYENLARIVSSSDRGKNLTNQLLIFSRKHSIELQPLNLNENINNMLKMLSRLIGPNFTVEFNPDDNLYQVNADAGNIEQIIMNLVLNARDALHGEAVQGEPVPSGGKIIIKTENTVIDKEYCSANPEARQGNFVCLSVADTGVGMTKEIKARIFEPFFTTKEKGKGTGLGLSVVYGIVKQHQGWIHVYSEPARTVVPTVPSGGGSVFRVYLPANISTKNVPSKPSTRIISPADFNGRQERILAVEDDD